MIRQLMRIRRRQVLIDVNTQGDFFLDGGKAQIGNRRRVLAHIRRVIALARARNIPVISLCEIHPNNNGCSEIPYCLDGTVGQQKIHYTLLNNRVTFAADNNTDLPHDILRRHRQVILHNRSADPFEEPRIERLLSEIRASEFILIGAATEDAIEATALGLLQRGKNVSVVVDAVGACDKIKAKHALRKMGAKGAKMLETKRIAGTSHLKHVGAFKNGICDVEQEPEKVHAQ